MKIGVVALQGAVTEHLTALSELGAEAIPVKEANQLRELDGLVLPGGESTAIRRLMDAAQLREPLQLFSREKPVFGTCAGLILLAKEVIGEESHIGTMNVVVERNSFGRQIDSFITDVTVQERKIPAVFIRAPHIQSVGNNVEVLATVGDRIVLARDGHLLGCAFHPELTEDRYIFELFLEMVKKSASARLASHENVL